MSNIISEKSKNFAFRIVKLYRFLNKEKHEMILSKQILRSGTSIGANVVEAECAVSKNEFISKMYIAFKECTETLYWLDLLHHGFYITEEQYLSLYRDCTELKRILSSITKTARENTPK